MRFRCGAHWLGVETGRWTNPKVDLCGRKCDKCGLPNTRDDEFHLVFECPALSELRHEYADLFEGVGGPQVISDEIMDSLYTGGFCRASARHSASMRTFMDQQPGRVAAFVHKALELHRGLPPVPTEDALDPDAPEWQYQSGYSDTFESDESWVEVEEMRNLSDSQEMEEEWALVPSTN
jgi:hypothetical protein